VKNSVRLSILLSFALLVGAPREARAVAPVESPSESPSISDCVDWKSIDLSEKNLEIVYDGFGKVTMSHGLEMQPRMIASESGTSAALTLVKGVSLGSKFGIRVRYLNVKGLRSPVSNAWEVFWLMFNYQTTKENKKTTNYFIFKPNGVELGTAWNELDQKYLKTEEKPQAEWGKEYELELWRSGPDIQASIDKKVVLKFHDAKNELYSSGQSLAFYTEDAKVQVKSLELCQSPRSLRSAVKNLHK
jgi:hypothetical protein